jgi:acyl transferase domain-containing protein/NADPH:quinone reductase-like Zn-dependent oxidoreductase
MGRELLATYPVFAESMARSQEHLLRLGADWHLLAELEKHKESSRINEATLSQPCCTAIQIALVDLLKSWRIQPAIVCGHSSGEIAAAYAAGCITSEDSLRVAYFRGESVKHLKEQHPDLKGAMLAVGISADEAQAYIDSNDSDGKVVVACINSPSSVTLSGDEAALLDIQGRLAERGVFNRRMAVDTAYHSHHMEMVMEAYVRTLQDLKASPCKQDIQMVSSVTGEAIQGEQMDAAYWGANLTSPVLFAGALAQAVETARRDQPQSTSLAIVEIGPHSALGGPIKQIIKAKTLTGSISYHSALSRHEDASRTAVALAGELFVKGASIDFSAINDPHSNTDRRVLTNLPKYNWNHTTPHWTESRRSALYRHRKFPKHDLLGIPSIDSIPTEPTWRNYIRLEELPWLRGHCIGGEIIFPAAGYITMALEALKQQVLGDGGSWKNLRIKFRQFSAGRALIVPDNAVGVEVLATLRPYTYTARESSTSWKEFRIFSVSASGESTEHSRGLVTAVKGSSNDQQRNMTDATSNEFIEEATRNSLTKLNPTELYQELRSLGVDYTGPFQGQEHIQASKSTSVCRVKIPDVQAIMPLNHQQPHCIHPATLDICFQAVYSAMKVGDHLHGTFVLAGLDELEISSEIPSRPGEDLSVATSLRVHGHSKYSADLVVSTSDSTAPEVLLQIKGLVFARTSGPSTQSASKRAVGESLCHRLQWSLDPACAQPRSIVRRCDLHSSDTAGAGRASVFEEYCRAVIKSTLAKLSPEDEGKITGHFVRLLRWMKARNAGSHEPLEMNESLDRNVKSLGIYGEVLVDMAPLLPGILRGEVDPLAMLLQDEKLHRLYNHVNNDKCNDQLASYVKLLQFKNPNLRILEIGAGTASASMPVLEALYSNKAVPGQPRQESYTFTDISPAFFHNAEKKLAKFQDSLEFKRLDIEVPPEEQGFELGSYDLIIASNVLHATSKLDATLRNVRSLLKPTGQVALVEVVAPKLYFGMIFGTLPGWWLGAAEGRQDTPLLEIADWQSTLSRCGFSGVDVEMRDYASLEDHEFSVIISSGSTHPESSDFGRQELSSSDSSMWPTPTTSRASSVLDAFPKSLVDSADDSQQTILVISGSEESSIADHVVHLLQSGNPSVQATKTTLAEAKRADGQLAVVLLETIHPFLATCSESEWEQVRQILCGVGGVLWVSCGGAVEATNPLQSLIVGLTRCLRSEDHYNKIITLDLESNAALTPEIAGHIVRVLDHAFGPDAPQNLNLPEFEYAIRGGEILIPRLVNDVHINGYVKDTASAFHPREEQGLQSGRALGLNIREPGLLDTFYWADSERHSQRIGAEEVRVELQYVSLNFKDVMTAMGQLDGYTALLLEGSGKVVEVGEAMRDQYSIGDSVYAVDTDGLATTSVVNKWNVTHIPKGLSMEVATAVPLAYATALYSLRNAANLQEGESILIHCGAGAVGQAAIALAQYFKAGRIFVTVGNEEKRAFIRERFGITDDDIFSSRDLEFSNQIPRRTSGQGVDVVLNSLSGEALQKSCSLLAPFGRFVEIGKKDLISDARLEMGCLEKNVSFMTVDLTLIERLRPAVLQKLFRSVFDLVSRDGIKVLSPIKVNSVSDLGASVRLMQTGKHMGKLLLKLDSEMVIPVRQFYAQVENHLTDSDLQVQPRQPPAPELKGDCSYLMIGGTGGLGRAILKHLAGLGAKRIVTLSRTGSDSQYMTDLVDEMLAVGVEVVVCRGSVTDQATLLSIKEQAKQFPIRGIVQGAMVLQASPKVAVSQVGSILTEHRTPVWKT